MRVAFFQLQYLAGFRFCLKGNFVAFAELNDGTTVLDNFDTVIDNSSYKACLNSYFKLIDEICAMPLEQLQDRLNSKESLDMLQHNQTLYNQRNEIKLLIKKLNNLFEDK